MVVAETTRVHQEGKWYQLNDDDTWNQGKAVKSVLCFHDRVQREFHYYAETFEKDSLLDFCKAFDVNSDILVKPPIMPS